jgi:predicted nucleic acid-binding protein
MTRPRLPTEPERLVTNTGPLIALGRVKAFEIVGQLPFKFIAPVQVADEIATGARLGHSVRMPDWVEVVALNGPVAPASVSALDEGEAAVIQLALELAIKRVCIDEWRGRRAALSAGLQVAGHLACSAGQSGWASSLPYVRGSKRWPRPGFTITPSC